jgi:CheY-like chemotaxis protein
VDDERDAADTLVVLLELAGFEGKAFYNGQTALAALDEFRPDAAILDLTMPGMDGCALARRLRAWAADRPFPIVAVTALGDDHARQLTAAAGFDLHLVKPVDPDSLALTLADMVILQGGSTEWMSGHR